MRFKKILLVNPPSKGEWKGFRPHIGLGYIAQYLTENGIEYDVIDMNLRYKYKHLQKKIDKFKPDLVGMSLLTFEYKKFYNLISMIKAQNSGIKVVVGGPHVTILKDQVMKDCTAIDYGVLYEGEDTLLELCKGEVPEDEIKSLMSRKNGTIIYPGDRGFIMDLDKLPFPKYEKFELHKYIPEVEIYSSRGCPHKCIFCPNRLLSPIFRTRSPRHVVDEMEYWYKKGYRQFNFDDDNFNKDKDRVYKICDEIERRELTNIFIRCSNGIRADRVDRPLLSRMREVGFDYIAFGADAANDKMLKIVKKGETMEDIEQALKNAYELGYNMKLLFIVGVPGETREDVEDKVRLSTFIT
jgi:anaerobic magnesium-protoporphyrin IX monomethyl ester cyclase